MKNNVYGLAKNQDQAQKIISHLQQEGFRVENISFLVYDKDNQYTKKNARGELEVNQDVFTNAREVQGGDMRTMRKKNVIEHEKHSKAPEGATTGAVAGGVIGGSLGLLAGLGALAIPGLGPFIAAGPIIGALSGSGIGGGVGLLLGALIGLGFPEYEAKKIEKRLQDGSILINVDTLDPAEAARAEQILKNDGATNVSTAVKQ